MLLGLVLLTPRYLSLVQTTFVLRQRDQALLCIDCSGLPDSTNLVDPASSHMLVSKIKPCKSKYKLIYTAKLRIAHYNSYNLHDDHYQMDIHGNSGANTCKNTRPYGKVAFISTQNQSRAIVYLVIIMTERIAFHATVRSSF